MGSDTHICSQNLATTKKGIQKNEKDNQDSVKYNYKSIWENAKIRHE